MSALIGRQQEVDEVAALLRRDDVRMVTITGSGGVGKTRLALAVSDEIATDFRDGVVTVPLASVGEPDLVLPTVAREAGLRETEGESLADIEDQLRDAEMLLVLDNLEQVASVGPHLTQLLAACPRVKLAATSRARLRVSLEHEFPLAPLAVPDCVTLFIERARAVAPSLDTDAESLLAIERLCVGLEGLPLAIELAAARVKMLPPEALYARLSDRLALLTGGPHDVPARQQTLRSTLDWSFELLREDEQRLFARLSVFAGGFTLESGEAVCDADIDTLATLVDNSLVHTDKGRFVMLETVRAYAAEQLVARSEPITYRERHAAVFLGYAEHEARLLTAPEQASALSFLEAEHANLRAALLWCIGERDVDTGFRIASALWGFWLEHGYVGEGRGWLRQLLADDGTADVGLRATALTGAAVLAHYAGDYSEAEELARQSLDLHTANDDRQGMASALEALALAVRTRGDFTGAETLFEQAHQLFRELDDEQGAARTLDRLGIAAWFGGKNDRAAELIGESLAAFRRLDDRAGIGLALTDLGLVELSRGVADTASELLEQGLALSREVEDRRNVAKALYGLGDVARLRDELERAAARYDEGLAMAFEYGFRWLETVLLERIAGMSTALGAPEQAARLFGAAAALREAIGAPMPAYFRERYETELEQLHGRLDDDTIRAAWEEGRNLPADAVLTTAREALPVAPAAGFDSLTSREIEVLTLVAQGLTDGQIARRLVVSPRTVHAHVRSIYRKLDVGNRSEATRYAVEHGPLQDR